PSHNANTHIPGSALNYVYSDNQSDQSYDQLPINSTTDNAAEDASEEFNDLSDLFSSSQGDILDCELSEIQDVNDLVSSIKSSPLRSLMLSPQKLTQMTEDDKLSQFFMESPNKCKMTLQQTMENSNFTAATSGFISGDMSSIQQDMVS